MTLAQSIRAWRRRWGLTQSKAAAVLGVNRRSLENWEQGRAHPSEPALKFLNSKLRTKPNQ
jgi:putative transcriptional regulator